MDFKSLFDPLPLAEKKALADRLGKHVVYLYQIAKGDRQPSPAFAKALVEAEPRLSLHELRPDIWAPPSGKRQRAKAA